MDKKTKIVATLGFPTASDEKIVLKLRQAGMNVARLNFSHGTHEERQITIKILRDIEEKYNLPTAILLDLQGPRIRLGDLREEPIRLEREQNVTLFFGKDQVDELIPVQTNIFPYLEVGHRILINDGLVKLRVDYVKENEARCRVMRSGEIKSHKGVNLPDTHLPNMSLTEKDKIDLAFGLEQKVDYVAISFVQTAEDVNYLRSIINKHTHHPKIIVKLETASGVKHLEEIMSATDGIMVARGDLAVEIGQEEVPIIQRRIIALARKHKKPVIVATQMLESMIKNAEPTRAEVSDVATAVLDQVDAVMLSAETAAGNFPVETVEMMDKIIRRVERYHHEEKEQVSLSHIPSTDQTSAVAAAASILAQQLKAKKIFALTASGKTALYLSSYRVSIAICAITDDLLVSRQLLLAWGVSPYYAPKGVDYSQLYEQDKLEMTDTIVKVEGTHPGKAGHTNQIRVTRVGDE